MAAKHAQKISGYSDQALAAFNKWFTSAGGVWHTLIGVAAIVISEQTHLINDHNGFWLLYWLTVYSAVTQPALAYVAKQGGDTQESELAHQALVLQHLETIVEQVTKGKI